MKKIFIMRGCPGSGKTSLIKDLGLEDYTLSLDNIRLMANGLEYNIDSEMNISQKYNSKVYKIFTNLLEMRLKEGAFTIYDATNTNIDYIRSLKKIIKEYEYKAYVVNFDDISLEELLERNKHRGYKKVPEDVIIKMFNELQESNNKIPSWVNVIKPEEMEEEVMFYTKDLSEYKKIHHIGDIHSSYDVLEEYFKKNDWMKEDEYYIFLGDFLDRGTQSKEVLDFMLKNYYKSNVLFIKGNHERHLFNYAKNKPYNKNSFHKTKEDIEKYYDNSIKKEIRQMSRKFVKAFKYKYNDKIVLCTHGGLPDIPNNINLINDRNLVNGVGGYKQDIDKIFTNNNLDNNLYQVHGHRNMHNIKIDEYKKSFNLEGQVEFGKYLRILTLDKNGFKPIYIKNNNYIISDEDKMLKSVKDMYKILSEDTDINVKSFGHIKSLNFKKNVFYRQSWNKKNIKARGLFINTNNYSIACRGYDKFFNYNEEEFNTDETIKNLEYPLNIYIKENGFLGLLGYDETNDELVFASKSTVKGPYRNLFKDIFDKNVSEENKNLIKEHFIKNNSNFVFEVIDSNKDPHIIKYDEPQIVLLDEIYRQPEFKNTSYKDLQKVAKKFNLKCKDKITTVNNYNEYKDFINNTNNYDFKFNNNYIEGFIVEDSNQYLFKVKSPYYNFWKYCRKILYNKDMYIELYNSNKLNKNNFYFESVGFLKELQDKRFNNMLLDFLIFIKDNNIDKNANFIQVIEDFKNK